MRLVFVDESAHAVGNTVFFKKVERVGIKCSYHKNDNLSLALVAHTCNPSHSVGRDQEDQGSKPTPGKKFMRPYLKRTGGVAQVPHKHEALSLNPSTALPPKKASK
jgi:hypothetical protein